MVLSVFKQKGEAMESNVREPIVWKTIRPSSFPCSVCSNNEADQIAYLPLIEGMIPIQMPVCNECAALSDEELLEVVFPSWTKDKEQTA